VVFAESGFENAVALTDVLAKLALPVVVAVLGFVFNAALKSRDTRVRMIELALDILKTPPKPEAGEGEHRLRAWAVKILEKHSELPFDAQAKDMLERRALSIGVGDVELPGSLAGSGRAVDIGVWTLELFSHRDLDKAGRIAEILDRLNFDLVGLCEIREREALDALVASMTEAGGQRWDYLYEDADTMLKLALVYRGDRVRVERMGPSEAFADHLDERFGEDPVFKRKPLAARCEVQDRGKLSFVFVLVHLKSPLRAPEGSDGYAALRTRSIELLADYIRDLSAQAPGLPFVVGGTFQEQAESASLAPLRQLGLRLLTLDAATKRRMGFLPPIHDGLLDHVLVSPSLNLLNHDGSPVLDLEAFAPDFRESFSDHLPLVARAGFPNLREE
jgi:endonuclease/exonuclease/phosphatase family metal-dependent hydrolase